MQQTAKLLVVDGVSQEAVVGKQLEEVFEPERECADDALRVSKAGYRAIFEASADAIFVHDIDTGRIVDINQRACEIYCRPWGNCWRVWPMS